MSSKIYLYDINDFDGNNLKLEEKLSSEIVFFVKKYKLSDDYLRSLLGWSILRKQLLEDFSIDLNSKEIKFNENGKPYINEDISFNLSHSHNYVAVIISDTTCGIDVELYDEERDWNKLKNNILSSREISLIKNNMDVAKYWSIKEAYFKCKGTGILLSKLKEDMDYSQVKTTNVIDVKGNKYFISYMTDENEVIQINKINVV